MRPKKKLKIMIPSDMALLGTLPAILVTFVLFFSRAFILFLHSFGNALQMLKRGRGRAARRGRRPLDMKGQCLPTACNWLYFFG